MTAETTPGELNQIPTNAHQAESHQELIQFVGDGKVVDASRLINALKEAFGDIKAVIQGNEWNSGAGHR